MINVCGKVSYRFAKKAFDIGIQNPPKHLSKYIVIDRFVIILLEDIKVRTYFLYKEQN